MSKPIPVRLDENLIRRLDAIATRIGSNRAAVIRMLVQIWVEDFEKRGQAALPVNWRGIMDGLDARRTPPAIVPFSSSRVAETNESPPAADRNPVKYKPHTPRR